jgi:hypothetical protein
MAGFQVITEGRASAPRKAEIKLNASHVWELPELPAG